MRLLLVEDDDRVAAFLLKALQAEAWTVERAKNVPELREWMGNPLLRDMDVVILDRMLQGEDSLHSIPLLRRAQPQLKILCLSALSTPNEKAAALDAGADDYLGKPYSLVELSARLRVLLRRGAHGAPTTTRQLGNLCLDFAALRATVGEKPLDLSAKEFKLLNCLSERPGQVLTKFQLLDRVWEIRSDVESNVVESTMSHLRRKLEEVQAELRIQSRRNVGYWLELSEPERLP